jgi:histone-lysine N-methyltransferase SETMAR
MSKVRDFIAALARAGKTAAEIKNLVEAAFADQALGLTSIYNILKKVKAGKNTDDQRHLNAKRTKRSTTLVADVAAAVENDARATCVDLASAFGVSRGTIHNILRDDLGLVKKSARWVPKILSDQGAWEDLHRVCRCRHPSVQGHAGQHHHHGRDDGVLPHP